MPADYLAIREGFRARLLTLVVATTGSTTLAASSTGFSRSSGSFLSEKFTAGMEITGDGFSAGNNAPATITSVAALSMAVPGKTLQTAAAGRTLTVGLPLIRQWALTQTPQEIIQGTRASIVEVWSNGVPADEGAMVDEGSFIVTLNLPGNYGIAAMLRYQRAMLDLFYPGWGFFVDGNWVRVIGNPAPAFSDPRPLENGQATSQLTVNWRVATTNLLDQP
jgi:hypothetical protein